MAKIHLNLNNRLDVFVSKFNDLSNTVGDVTLLTTTGDSDLVQAVNEHDAELGTITSLAMGTTASTVSGAIAELDSDRDKLISKVDPDRALTTLAATITAAINEHDAELGTISSAAMGTGGETVSAAIRELDSDRDKLIAKVNPNLALQTSAQTITAAINEHEGNIGNMIFTGLSASNISAGLRELRTELGDHTSLNTTATNAVGAINELNNLIDSVSANVVTERNRITQNDSDIDILLSKVNPYTTFTTTSQTVIPAINELKTRVDNVDSNTDTNTTNIGNMVLTGFTAVDISGGLRELKDDIATIRDSSGITFASVVSDIADLTSDIGDLTALNTTNKNSLVEAINEAGLLSVVDAGGDGSLTVLNGVLTYTGPSASEVRAHFSAGNGIAISSGSIAIKSATRFRLYDSTGATLLDLYGAGSL